MSRPWFETRPNLLERIRADLRIRYPDLQVVQEAGVVFARGSLPIIHQGTELDRYQIEIEFPPDYPKNLPRVRETGGRVPLVLDRHVIPSTGTACLFVEEDWLAEVGREELERRMVGPQKREPVERPIDEEIADLERALLSLGLAGALGEKVAELQGEVRSLELVRWAGEQRPPQPSRRDPAPSGRPAEPQQRRLRFPDTTFAWECPPEEMIWRADRHYFRTETGKRLFFFGRVDIVPQLDGPQALPAMGEVVPPLGAHVALTVNALTPGDDDLGNDLHAYVVEFLQAVRHLDPLVLDAVRVNSSGTKVLSGWHSSHLEHLFDSIGGMSGLRSLRIETELTPALRRRLERLPLLTGLAVDCKVTDQCLTEAAALERLRVLRFGERHGTAAITQAALRRLESLTGLESLELSLFECDTSALELDVLVRLPRLRNLTVFGMSNGPELPRESALLQIAQMPTMERITLENRPNEDPVSSDTLDALRAMGYVVSEVDNDYPPKHLLVGRFDLSLLRCRAQEPEGAGSGL